MPLIIIGCNNQQSQTVPSSVAQLKAFSFVKNDSFPGLEKAVFTVEERLDTGLVWNKDSMLYGTRLDSVVPRFTFEATPSAAFLKFPDTTVSLTGYDTLNFNKQPIYLTIRSADKSNIKTYEIRPTVHRIDPDLYIWTQLCASIYPQDDSEQRVVELGNDFVMISSNGFELHAYKSADGITWSDLGKPAGLPAGTKVRQMISSGKALFYGQDSSVYTSPDAVTWTEQKMAAPVRTMLMYWNEHIWALTGEEENYELAIFQGDSLKMTGLQPDGEFPISDFATVTFMSPSLRDRAMIIGGFAENGRSLNSRWNIEYSRHTQENGGYRMQDYSIDRPRFTSLTGVSVINYNHQLLLFGGVDDKMTYFGRNIYISNDEGLNWTPADTTKNKLPGVYTARQKQTAIVRDDCIYLFGGQDATTTYSDVYRGRLNSIGWND